VVVDLGQAPQMRYLSEDGLTNTIMPGYVTTANDIKYIGMASDLSGFKSNNRAGIDGTLHRISCIRYDDGSIIGLTMRVGRAVAGSITVIADLIRSGKSVLLIGKPGVGKTTKLREACRILADEMGKRVMIVDSSSEIAGDGKVVHSAVGSSRRMTMINKKDQHKVMVEAVENHMPEVLVVDEISDIAEANAARTTSERGVQLLATVHGNTLENVMNNTPISIVVGEIQTVTLGDAEAKRRGTSKTVRERKYPPVFDCVVELIDFDTVAVHYDTEQAVDSILNGNNVEPEYRRATSTGFETISPASIDKPYDDVPQYKVRDIAKFTTDKRPFRRRQLGRQKR
jgi:stage III sporulation protein SpoIIIAA